jgi:hypothetical protein
MANQPIIIGTVKVTAKDINGNNIAKQFNSVYSLSFDYNKGMISLVDVTGQYYFPLIPMTTLTYTMTPSPSATHTIVMS